PEGDSAGGPLDHDQAGDERGSLFSGRCQGARGGTGGLTRRLKGAGGEDPPPARFSAGKGVSLARRFFTQDEIFPGEPSETRLPGAKNSSRMRSVIIYYI